MEELEVWALEEIVFGFEVTVSFLLWSVEVGPKEKVGAGDGFGVEGLGLGAVSTGFGGAKLKGVDFVKGVEVEAWEVVEVEEEPKEKVGGVEVEGLGAAGAVIGVEPKLKVGAVDLGVELLADPKAVKPEKGEAW